MNLLFNKEELYCTQTELLHFKVTQPLAKLDLVGSRLISNGLSFLNDTPVSIQ